MRTSATRTVSGRVYQDGAPLSGGGMAFTARKQSTGSYVITIPGAKVINAVAVGFTTTYYMAVVNTVAGSSFVVNLYNSTTGVGADVSFSFIAEIAN
jgi:hypothetical protein